MPSPDSRAGARPHRIAIEYPGNGNRSVPQHEQNSANTKAGATVSSRPKSSTTEKRRHSFGPIGGNIKR